MTPKAKARQSSSGLMRHRTVIQELNLPLPVHVHRAFVHTLAEVTQRPVREVENRAVDLAMRIIARLAETPAYVRLVLEGPAGRGVRRRSRR